MIKYFSVYYTCGHNMLKILDTLDITLLAISKGGFTQLFFLFSIELLPIALLTFYILPKFSFR